MKSLSTKELVSHLQDAVSWLLPVSLIIITFLILFFGISEQVGNLKVYSTRIADTVSVLKADVAQLKGDDVPSNIGASANTLTVSTENASITGIKSNYQKLQLTGDDLWGYTFISDSGVTLTKDVLVDFAGTKAMVLSYKKAENGEIAPFDVYKYSSVEKAISTRSVNVGHVVVFVEGKVVLYNDFANNDTSKAKELLKTIAGSKDIDPDLKAAALSEESKY
jgi:hypothetical protein